MSQFAVRGRYQTRDGHSDFETAIEAENENVAQEHALSQFGSRYGLKRAQTEIGEVQAR